MLDRLVHRLYTRMAPRYVVVFLFTQIPASMAVAVAFALGLVAYYDASFGQTVLLAAGAASFTAVGVLFSVVRQGEGLREIARWREREAPTAEETVVAWQAATSFAMRSYRRDSMTTNAIAAIPSVVLFAVVLGLSPGAVAVMLGAASLAAAYGTIVTYSLAEMLLRPAVAELAEALPPEFSHAAAGLRLRKRLMLSLPVFTATAGLATAAFVVEPGRGTSGLAESLGVAVLVALVIAFELTALLSRAITDPVGDLRHALARVSAGDYGARVRVMSDDDLGELSSAFNRMAHELAERERLREAFGTYLDKDVARFVLDTSFPKDGVEVTVTVMFCDAHAFTEFADQASPREVVAALNALFERIVPIITRHGGHVDKFLGDGVLAVFGVPEGYADHADRALAAGCEIVASVNADRDTMTVGVGLNTGRVVAGSIGGAGRLNFSVIGDTVNVAARVEEATRGIGDDLLLTPSVREALVDPEAHPLVSRGAIPLKGKAEPLELFTSAGGDAAVDPAGAVAGADR